MRKNQSTYYRINRRPALEMLIPTQEELFQNTNPGLRIHPQLLGINLENLSKVK